MSLGELVNHPAWIHLGLSLAHFLWQGAAIAMLLAIGLFLSRRRSPELRHGLCLGAMLIMAACPLVTLWYFHANPPNGLTLSVVTPVEEHHPYIAEASPVEQPGATDPVTPSHAPETEDQATTSGILTDNDAASESPVPEAQTPSPGLNASAQGSHAVMANGPTSPANHTSGRTPRLAWGLTIAAVVWAAGVALLGVRFVLAWLRLWRFRKGTDALPEAIERVVERLRGAMGIRRRVPVRASHCTAEPLAFGLLRPVVLVPASLLTQCPVEMLEAMIAHELAHIRRHDLWINLLQRVIETLLFYHPAVWWVSGRMRLERELCCDDLAVRATGRRADYAGALVELSRTLHGWAPPILTTGMFTSRLSLPTRVRRILQVSSAAHDPNRGRYWMAGPLTLLVAGLMVLISSLHAGFAQDGPAAAPPASTQPSTAPAWWKLSPKSASGNFEPLPLPLPKAIDRLSEITRLPVISNNLTLDSTKTITVKTKSTDFDEILTEFDRAILDQGYWLVRQGEHLVLREASEWMDHIPRENFYESKVEYMKAKLPGWQVAGLKYHPARLSTPEMIEAMKYGGQGVRLAALVPDERSFVMSGLVLCLNPVLEQLRKVDSPEARGPATRPAGRESLPLTVPAERWTNVQMGKVLSEFAGASNLMLVASQVQAGDLQSKSISVDTTRAQIFDEASIVLNEALFDVNYWAIVRDRNLVVRPVSEWYRNVPANHMFMSEEAYQRARLPQSEVATVVFEPRSWPADVLANEGNNRIPLNGARAQVTPDGRRVELTGFVRFVNDQLAIMKKWDVPPPPTAEMVSQLRSATGRQTASAGTPRVAAGTAVRPAAETPSPEPAPLDSRTAVRSAGRVPVRPMTDGIVTEVLVKPGQTVKKGELLVRLDDQEAQLELKSAMVRLEQARREYDRLKQLAGQHSISESELQKARADAELAELGVERWKLRIERTRICSPADGVAQDIPGHLVGTPVTAGELLMFVDQSSTSAGPAQTQPAGGTGPLTPGRPSGPRPAREGVGAVPGPEPANRPPTVEIEPSSPARAPRGPAVILAPAAGMVAEVSVRLLQHVKKGDVLVKLDARDAELELQAAKIRLNAAQERLAATRSAYEKGLTQNAEVKQAESAVALAEVEIKRIELQIEKATIRSPIDGITSITADDPMAQAGRLVAPGQVLLRIMPEPETRPAAGAVDEGGEGR